MIKKGDIKNLAKSFSYAFKGIGYCIKNERNMRIHICVALFVSIFSCYFKITAIEYTILAICMGFVITNEMINTAIETLTNLESPAYNNLARIAKDVAAGAVFVSAVTSIVVGFIVFFKPQKLFDTLCEIALNPISIIIFVLFILLSLLFIFNGTTFIKEPKTKVYHMKNYDDKK